MVTTVVLVGALLSCLSLASSAQLERVQEDFSFDVFLFVRQWDPSYCDHHRCSNYPKRTDFTIHGLWPDYGNGSYPQFCKGGKPFDAAAIQDLLPALEEAWPSFAGSDESFWKHEWDKHGTCTSGVFQTEREYFATILQLHKQLDLLSALENAGVTPSPDTQYDRSQLQQAVKDDPQIGAWPLIECIGGDLTEVQLCLTPTLQLVDCSIYPKLGHRNSCKKVIMEPAHARDSTVTTSRK